MHKSTLSTPRTLLQITDAEIRPATLDRAVLVIVDAQEEYVSGKLPLSGIDAAITEASCVLRLARESATPVVHIVQHSSPGRPVFAPGTRGAEIVSKLAPLPSELVMPKALPNAFAGTSLAERLQDWRASGRPSIILCGFMTHMCISATARAALDLGISATVVANATATRDLPNPYGGTIPADVVHSTALAEIADRFAAVVENAAGLLPAS